MSDPVMAEELHGQVGGYCFIARSIDTPIHHEVVVQVEGRTSAEALSVTSGRREPDRDRP